MLQQSQRVAVELGGVSVLFSACKLQSSLHEKWVLISVIDSNDHSTENVWINPLVDWMLIFNIQHGDFPPFKKSQTKAKMKRCLKLSLGFNLFTSGLTPWEFNEVLRGSSLCIVCETCVSWNPFHTGQRANDWSKTTMFFLVFFTNHQPSRLWGSVLTVASGSSWSGSRCCLLLL